MEELRPALTWLRDTLAWLPNPVVALIMAAIAALIALAVHRWARLVVRRLLAGRYPVLYATITQMRGLTKLAVLVIALFIVLPALPIDWQTRAWIGSVLLVVFIALLGWGAITGLRIAADVYLLRFRVDTADNLLARKHITQIRVLLRSADVVIIVFTIAAALMTFEPVRQYGYSLFASAGVAGIVAGLAARPVLSNLFAGVQLAMTQPIRLDDAVIVEGEFGTIEEITSTYVVVKLWDWRRMVVPLTYFIEKPFQNWTRDSSALIGTAMFYLDYRAPIARMREKLKEICANSKNWDGQVLALQITDTKQATIEVRTIMSARTGGQAFDLRCEVREQMIDFLQREHPEALPVQRNEPGATAQAHAKAVQAALVTPADAHKGPPQQS
jgi:small-conductance mechanosensitive channel